MPRRFGQGVAALLAASSTSSASHSTALLAAPVVVTNARHEPDSSRGASPSAASPQLGDDLGGEVRELVQVGHVEQLEIDPLDARLGERSEVVDDLRGRADQR